jgi:plasmid stabilization system protein ParE
MNVHKSDEFIADVERQFEWYVINAGWDVADRYLDAVEAVCRHPNLGPCGRFAHTHLCGWRFFLVFQPFNRHVLFYELTGDLVVMRRAMLGQRDLPRRLAEPPETE